MKQRLIQLVGRLKPGERIDIAWSDLQQIPPYEHNGAVFDPVPQILGNIIGASYEFRAWDVVDKQQTTFERLRKPLGGSLRASVTPDCEHLFRKRLDGFYEFLNTREPATTADNVL